MFFWKKQKSPEIQGFYINFLSFNYNCFNLWRFTIPYIHMQEIYAMRQISNIELYLNARGSGLAQEITLTVVEANIAGGRALTSPAYRIIKASDRRS